MVKKSNKKIPVLTEVIQYGDRSKMINISPPSDEADNYILPVTQKEIEEIIDQVLEVKMPYFIDKLSEELCDEIIQRLKDHLPKHPNE